MSAALEFRDISLSFGKTRVLHGVNLRIEHGERHALIGPNGAGKSTLFNLACGVLRPDEGRLFFKGESIAGLAAHTIARRGLARSHQVMRLFAPLSVRDNLRCAALGAHPARYAFWRSLERLHDVAARVEEVAAVVGLRERLDLPAGELPYGEQRALDIGITLAATATPISPATDNARAVGAPLVLLDEPTAGLGPDESRAMVELIRRVSAGRTLLLVEHDMDVVFELADRVSVLADGRVIASGTPDAIRRDPRVQTVYPTGELAHA